MTIAYMLIMTKHGKVKLVHSALNKFKELIEIHELYGQYDIIAKLKTKTNNELKALIQNRIFVIDGISKTETLIVFDEEDEADVKGDMIVD